MRTTAKVCACAVRRTRHRVTDDESGMTLVEIMAAILIIGLVLSALASVLTTSLRAIVHNERESTATAFAQQEIERMQAVDWDFAGLLDTEVDAAPAEWSVRLDSATTYDGAELVEISAPSGAETRPEQIPQLTSSIVRQNTTYEVSRYITWVDRTNNSIEETRRFTVVVAWEALGQSREITVTAERIPTLGEATSTELGTRLLNFFRAPDPVQLSAEGTVQTEVEVEVRLSQGVTGGRLRYHHAVPVYEDTDGDGVDELTRIDYTLVDRAMDGSSSGLGSGYSVWRLTIPTDEERFVEGTMPLHFVAEESDGGPFEVYGSLKLIGSDAAGTYPSPPSIVDGSGGETDDGAEEPSGGDGGYDGEVVINSALIVTSACRNTTTWKLSEDLLLRVDVDGLTDDDLVEATYTYRSKPNTGNGNLKTATERVNYVSGNEFGAIFELTLPANGDRYFADGDQIDFNVTARRDSKNDSETSPTAAFVNQGTSPC